MGPRTLDKPVKNSACSGTGRITKGSLLSMMGYGPYTQPSLYNQTLSEQKRDRILAVIDACGGNLNRAAAILGIKASSLRRMTKEWESAKTPTTTETTNPTRRFYERINNPWRVSSFDPDTRQVCIEIDTPSSKSLLNYTIPEQKPADY